jgi:hypothetical protein
MENGKYKNEENKIKWRMEKNSTRCQKAHSSTGHLKIK